MPNEPTPSPTPPTGRRLAAFRITADRLAFYSNRYILGGEGNVQLVLGDGTRVRGNTFAMDLRLNRFVMAGNVKVTTASDNKEIDGAAFAEYFSFDRAYFVPILSEPDRWTFASGDYAHPLLGREMPGDTFYLPDLAGERAFLYAKRATVKPQESIRFASPRINFGLTFLTFPSYFLNFSQNPNFAQNALQGAYIDGPLDFAGGDHGLATMHVRYDSVNKVYLAYEQHQVSDNHYLVFSIDPLTKAFKQYNFLAYDRISPGLQVQMLAQESAFQYGLAQPLSAVAYVNLMITGSLPHSYLQLTTNSYYDSLLAPPPVIDGLQYYGAPNHNFIPYHPVDLQLSWIGVRHRINDLPLSFQLRSGLGFDHDGLTPVQSLGNVNYYSEYDKLIGANLSTSNITLIKDRAGRHRDLYFTGSFDKQREYFSLPHHIDTTTTSLSVTKFIDPQKLAVLLSYANQNTSDFYGAQQSIAYPNDFLTNPYISPITGLPVPGYNFTGFATTRSLIQQMVFTPNPNFTVNFSMRENHDFPKPIAGLVLGIGDTLVFNNYGLAPYQANLDVRFRVNRLLVLDIGRSYYFNFGGYERWSPQFSFQVQK
jgi:hypothetical protein